MTSADPVVSLNAYDLSVALFVRGLTNLKSLLKKGEAYASATSMNPVELIEARLASDMVDLAAQVHWSAEGAKLAVERLRGSTCAPSSSDAKSFGDLCVQIDTTMNHLTSVDRRDLEGALGRPITIEHRSGSMQFTGAQFLLEFAIPTFFFHVTTAYAILRHAGVEVTKGDFLGATGVTPQRT
jgi:hypothetical protein